MPVGNWAADVALQHEKVRPDLELMYQQDWTLWGKIKARGDIEVVSGRPTRVPMELLAGGKGRVFNPDGGNLGRGSAPQTDLYTLTPIYIEMAGEYTKKAEIDTNNKEKAIENYVQLVNKRLMTQMNVLIEAMLAYGDGANTLDTVVSTATNQITVNNANQFYDNQDIDIYASVGGASRGTCTIQSVDAGNKQLNLTGAIPTGTTAGDVILVNGSANAASSGFYGINYYQFNGNTGNIGGLRRSSYPGKLSTPYVSGSNKALTPSRFRLQLAQMEIALGIDAIAEDPPIFHVSLAQQAAWENLALNVAIVNQQEVGETSVDMLPKRPPKTMGGYQSVPSIHAQPGRIDGLCLKCWFRCEDQPIDYYEVGGQTLFPAYASDGGLQTSMLFYIWTGVQVGQANVRKGCYSDANPIPAGY